MQAVTISEYGDNSVVQVVDVDQPRPGAGELLVKVHAAGVNPVDWKIRDGLGERFGLTLPIRLGGEMTGTIEAFGDGVNGFQVGEAVYGMVKSGGFAEYVIAKPNAVSAKPASLDFIQAAALPLAGLTAWQAMFDLAGLREGHRLLVTNGSGGVGSLAVQFAKAKGAHVTAMASGRNERFIRDLGADEFIDYTKQPFEQVAHAMDVVFDIVGGTTFQRAFVTLKKGGFLVTAVAFPKDEGKQYDVGVGRISCTANAAQLASIGELADAGKVKPHVAEVVPMRDVKRAFEMSESGRTRGKIVLQIGGL